LENHPVVVRFCRFRDNLFSRLTFQTPHGRTGPASAPDSTTRTSTAVRRVPPECTTTLPTCATAVGSTTDVVPDRSSVTKMPRKATASRSAAGGATLTRIIRERPTRASLSRRTGPTTKVAIRRCMTNHLIVTL
jgi:hypothetical protein